MTKRTLAEFPQDEVLRRRSRAQLAATWGKRLGYFSFGAAMICFFVAFIVGFNDRWALAVGVLLALGSFLLLPSIIVGYGVKDADRHDRGLPSRH